MATTDWVALTWSIGPDDQFDFKAVGEDEAEGQWGVGAAQKIDDAGLSAGGDESDGGMSIPPLSVRRADTVVEMSEEGSAGQWYRMIEVEQEGVVAEYEVLL